jgi:hypothetical protein
MGSSVFATAALTSSLTDMRERLQVKTIHVDFIYFEIGLQRRC